MSFEFRDAVRSDTRLLIGLAGGTGSGKTESSMRLATGLADGKPFAVIDTESGRALHKADDYRFKHGDLTAPFTPERYWEAIAAADSAGFPVIVIDSFSHVWEGVGGVLEQQEQELERLGGSAQMAPKSWIKPKGRHRRLVNQMLQVRAHLIVCMRAQDKIEIAKEGGKTVVRPAKSLIGADGWIPICERRFPHELTISLLLLQDAPGVPKPIKLERRHESLVPLDRPLDEEVGVRLAAWAAGSAAGLGVSPGGSPPAPPSSTSPDPAPTPPPATPDPVDGGASGTQLVALNALVERTTGLGLITHGHLWEAVASGRGLSQAELAEQIGATAATWEQLRRGLTPLEADGLMGRLARLEANAGAAA